MGACDRVCGLVALMVAFGVTRSRAEDCSPGDLMGAGRPVAAVLCMQTLCRDIPEFCNNVDGCDSSIRVPGSGTFLQAWQVCPARCGKCRSADALAKVEAAIGRPCDAGWEYIDGVCFKHFLEPSEDGIAQDADVTWFEAQDRCRQEGAQLADVDEAPHRHMALELVRRRPLGAGGLAFMAWVSWPAGHASAGGAEPRNGSAPAAAPIAWLNTFDRKGFLENIESFQVVAGLPNSTDLGFYARSTHVRIGGWVCSRRARFHHIEDGSCEEVGLQTINSVPECEAAARLLKMADTVALTWSSSIYIWPTGCLYRAAKGGTKTNDLALFQRGIRFNRRNNSLQTFSVQICMPALNSSISAAEQARQNQTWHDPDANASSLGQISSSIDAGPWLCISCLLSYVSVVLVAVWNWKPITSAGRHALDFMGCIIRRFAVKPSRHDSSALESLVTSTMRRRRATFACFTAVMLLTTHLFWLTSLAMEPTLPCGGQGPTTQAQILMEMLGHLGQILVTSAFLVLQATEACRGSWTVRAFALATFVLRCIQEAMLRGHPLLWQNRPWYELLWRILVGMSLDVPSMAGLVVLRSAGTVLMYSISIPDNMIIVRLAATCTELWSVDVMLKTFDDFARITRVSAQLQLVAPNLAVVLTNMNALLTFFASESTSLRTFAATEAFQCLALILCLAAVGHVMAEETRSAARLQSSQFASEAVSGILDRLCDAVVTVDSQCVITKPAPRLASLLATSASVPLEGVDLRSRMPPEDAETLRWNLDGGPGGVGCPSEAMALSLVDSLSIRVRCEFFMAEFRGDGLERNVVVGINEVGEGREATMYSSESVDSVSSGLALSPLREYVLQMHQENTTSEDGTSSAGSLDSDLSSCLSTMTGDGLEFEFKYFSGEIVAASPSFNRFVGRDSCIGTSVLDMMASKEKKEFSEWLKAIALGLANVKLPQEVVSEAMQLKVKSYQRSPPPVGQEHNTRKHQSKSRRQWATLTVTFPEKPVEQLASDYVLRVEVKKKSGPQRRTVARSETGFLSREAACRDVPGGQQIIGRSVVGL